jgi:hypothetical protein
LKSLLLLLHTSGVVLMIIPFTIEDIFLPFDWLIDWLILFLSLLLQNILKQSKNNLPNYIYSCKVIIIWTNMK